RLTTTTPMALRAGLLTSTPRFRSAKRVREGIGRHLVVGRERSSLHCQWLLERGFCRTQLGYSTTPARSDSWTRVAAGGGGRVSEDRKSTRLNSRHASTA